MPTNAVTIQDLENAKEDVDTIAAIATSPADTTVDRLGNVKLTMSGVINTMRALNPRGNWVTATAYAVRDLVIQSGTTYICTVAHTSGTFATDLAAGRWAVYQGVTGNDLADNVGPGSGADLVGYIGPDGDPYKLSDLASTAGNKGVSMVSGAPRVVGNVTALKALPGSLNPEVFTLGRLVVGDRGNALYRADYADTTSVDNGVDIHVATDGTRYKLVHNGVVNAVVAGAAPDGTGDSTTAVNNLIARAIAAGFTAELTGLLAVTKVLVTGTSVRITGNAVLMGRSSGTYDAVLEIKDVVDANIDGRIVVAGAYNSNYGCGVRIWADSGSISLVNLHGVTVTGSKIAFKVGDPSRPDKQVSELVISQGHAYGCPTFCEAYGTQTFVEFNGYQCRSSFLNGPGGWNGLPARCFVTVGGFVRTIGGEILMTETSSGIMVESRPITSTATPTPYPNSYGSFKATGSTIECGSPFVVTANPGSVSSPTNGDISFVDCVGIHTQNISALFQLDAQFVSPSKVTCKTNNFYCTTARSFSNIAASGLCDIYVDEQSFGRNFLNGIGGISGGIVHFDRRLICAASNLGGATMSGTQTLKFQVLDNTGDLGSRFSTAYSAGTGIFTVPDGGLKDVVIRAGFSLAAITAGELYIQINNVVVAVGHFNTGCTIAYSKRELAAGDQIKIVMLNISGGTPAAGSNPYDYMHIEARC